MHSPSHSLWSVAQTHALDASQTWFNLQSEASQQAVSAIQASLHILLPLGHTHSKLSLPAMQIAPPPQVSCVHGATTEASVSPSTNVVASMPALEAPPASVSSLRAR